MLPAVLDPWASHALYEAANLAKNAPGSKVWLVSLGPKAKLQQVMMTVAQKVPFELVALDGPASGFTEAAEVAAALAEAIQAIPGLDKSKLLVFGGWESASRGAGATMQMVGERLGITDQFQGVDELKIAADGSLEILERIEGGKHQISKCAGAPALLGWATGNLPEPKNNPQVGMVNMRTVMPALQKAKPVKLAGEGLSFASVSLPKQLRETKIVKDKSPDDIAKEIVEWIKKVRTTNYTNHTQINESMETILLLAHTEADGSLAKSAREALHAARTLNKSLAGSSLVVGLVGENVQAAADSIAACPATKYFGVAGKDFAQSRYAYRRRGGGSHLQIGPGHDCRRSGDVALGARAARRRATPRRTRRHPRDRCGRCGRQAGHQPLVLPPAHGSHAHPRATALVHSR